MQTASRFRRPGWLRACTILSLTAVLLAAALPLTGCAARRGLAAGEDSDSSAASRPLVSTVTPAPEGSEPPPPESGLPDLVPLAVEKWAINSDTVGWLRIPDTAIDDAVLWKPGDNDYYLRRNIEKRFYYNGVYYADKNAVFGDGSVEEIGKNTVLYGHSMSDGRDDVQFGPMRYYLEEEFARSHPYIYFSTVRDNMAWEVVAVYYTNVSMNYNAPNLTEDEFAAIFQDMAAKSLFQFGYEYRPEDRFLTLSTCVYSLPDQGVLEYPNDYRLCITARLVGAEEERKETANLTRNPNIRPA